MRVPLESQQYSFTLVNQALNRNAAIVVMRAKRRWEDAVPRLAGFPRLFTLNSQQNVAISRKNCVEGFPVFAAMLGNAASRDREMPS
jgi:hypothetical protein